MKIASRLDFWLIDKNVQAKLITTDIRPAIRADHNAISLKIRVRNFEKGPGNWKINSSILINEDYQRNIRNIVNNVRERDLNASDKWELIKIMVREFTQKTCRRLSSKKKDKERVRTASCAHRCG